MKVSVRTWISLVTFLLIAVLLYATRHELVEAWNLMSRVNLWILALFIPVVIASYLVSGEMLFSYLRQKKLVNHLSSLSLMRLSLEMNFVNHALPSGGASGVSYMTWRMSKLGVTASKATSAQMVRFVAGFAAFSALLLMAVLMITIDGDVNRWIILVSSTLVGLMVAATAVGIYMINTPARVRVVAEKASRFVNRITYKLTRGKKRVLLREATAVDFLSDMREDYLELRRNKNLLWRPFWWGIVFTLLDVLMYWIAFWSLGEVVNPAPILIAYGLATVAGFAVVTPGGSGAYEALMVMFLAVAGIAQGVAIAGIVLARVLILITILLVGYAFYQHAIVKYGKPTDTTQRK